MVKPEETGKEDKQDNEEPKVNDQKKFSINQKDTKACIQNVSLDNFEKISENDRADFGFAEDYINEF